MIKFPSQNADLWFARLLKDRLDCDFLIESSQKCTSIKVTGQQGEIRVKRHGCWTGKLDNLRQPKWWNAEAEGWDTCIEPLLPMPNLDCPPTKLIEGRDSRWTVEFDIVGFTFWTLNRIEEVDCNDFDQYGRFSGKQSYAWSAGYLGRPVVDEWLFILEQVIRNLWPSLEIKKTTFEIDISHDVDFPSLFAFKSWPKIAKAFAKGLKQPFNNKAYLLAPLCKAHSKRSISKLDPFNTFDWLLDTVERYGTTSTFFFMSGQTNKAFDGDYSISDGRILRLMQKLDQRGHHIGLHPSFETFRDKDRLRSETESLRSAFSKASIKSPLAGARMHYLRWSHPATLEALEYAGLSVDHTLGFADVAGFRCGTSHEFQAFDPVKNKILEIRLRPLVAMECSVIDQEYMGLGNSDRALKEFLNLKRMCFKAKGRFSLLWHNSSLLNKRDFELFEDILSKSID